MAGRQWVICLTVACLGLSGCASVRGYETPIVTVNSFRALPSQGSLPSFEIGLRVINPNREVLNLKGVAYTVTIEGHDIIQGVANDLPVIEGYGDGEFKLTASVSLLAGIRLFTEILNETHESVSYSLEAKLDTGWLMPTVKVADSGEIRFPQASAN